MKIMRSASNHPCVRAFLWLLCIIYFNLRFCSLLNYPVTIYTVTTLKSHTEKNAKSYMVCQALFIDRVFGNIFGQYFGKIRCGS